MPALCVYSDEHCLRGTQSTSDAQLGLLWSCPSAAPFAGLASAHSLNFFFRVYLPSSNSTAWKGYISTFELSKQGVRLVSPGVNSLIIIQVRGATKHFDWEVPSCVVLPFNWSCQNLKLRLVPSTLPRALARLSFHRDSLECVSALLNWKPRFLLTKSFRCFKMVSWTTGRKIGQGSRLSPMPSQQSRSPKELEEDMKKRRLCCHRRAPSKF